MNSPAENTETPGSEDYQGWDDYMERKKAKLLEQQKDMGQPGVTGLFSGLRFHVNGYTDPPASELKELVVQHGGCYEQYYAAQPDIYMIATHLPKAKIEKMTENKVVLKPNWILDCIAADMLLPIEDYRLYQEDGGNATVTQFFKKDEESPKGGRTTASDPNFVQNFYKSSRLHHLSSWREDLKQFAKTLMSQAEKKPDVDIKRIFHIDMDCFFASISTRDKPELAGKPVGISHSAGLDSKESSSSDLASVNYEARAFGIKNGMYTRKAMELCPNLVVLPYDFEAYQEAAYELYRILAKYAHDLQAVSCDEAFISVPFISVEQCDALANQIREEIRGVCGCNASVGIGPNMLVARLATRKAKPNGQFQVEDVGEFMAEQKLADLPGVGPALQSKLAECGWILCKDLYSVPLSKLQELLGPKQGKNIFDHAKGIDDRPLDSEGTRKSVGTEISWGVRFENLDQRDHFIEEMAKEVIKRLEAIGEPLTTKKMQVKLMRRQEDAGEPAKRLGRGLCDFFNKTVTIPSLTVSCLTAEAIKAIDSYNVPIEDIRGIGIFLVNLEEPKKTFDWTLMKKPKTEVPVDSKTSFLQARGFDPAVFAELDPQVQQDLLQEWGYYCHLPPKGKDVVTPAKRKTPAKTAGQPTIVSLLSKKPAKQDDLNKRLTELGIDPEFFSALPDCIKAELLDEQQPAEAPVVVIDDDKRPLVDLLDVEDLTSSQAVAVVERMLGDRDYEGLSKKLSLLRNRPGCSDLISLVQDRVQKEENSQLRINI